MIKKQVKIKGNIQTFTLAGWVKESSKFVGRLREYIKTNNKSLLDELRLSGAVLSVSERHNIVVTTGRTVLAMLLSGDATYSGEINYGALGTDATAATNADTTLGTEVYRKLASSQTYDENICYVDFFYAAGDCDGTYEEFGNFIDGAAGVDTGQLFSHMVTGSWVKSNTESLFVSCQYSIT